MPRYRHEDNDGGFIHVDHAQKPYAPGIWVDARECWVSLAKVPELVDAIRAKAQQAAQEHGVEQPDTIVLELSREDAEQLELILMSDRYRMDKGDDRPVPQPRWGANVRVSQAVAAALASREA